jgi:uncharacterized membrane protein YgdD (TMEM256/DUF423 family)
VRAEDVVIAAGAALAGIGVALGAFAAHGLEQHLSADLMGTFETGVRYQQWHAFGMLAAGLLARQQADADTSGILPAAWLFAMGVVLFSGSLYALVITGNRILGMVTPVGGLCFLAGWAWLAVAALRTSRASKD